MQRSVQEGSECHSNDLETAAVPQKKNFRTFKSHWLLPEYYAGKTFVDSS